MHGPPSLLGFTQKFYYPIQPTAHLKALANTDLGGIPRKPVALLWATNPHGWSNCESLKIRGFSRYLWSSEGKA